MLQAIRSRAGSLIVKILFGLLIVSFGVWGIGDIFRNRSADTTIATVGGQKIRAEELQTAVQTTLERLRQQTGSAIDLEQAKQIGLIGNVLDQVVSRSLLDHELNRLQLDVSDDVIRSTIFDDPTFRATDGKFNRAVFEQMLAINHMNEDQFVARLRQDLPRSHMMHAVTIGATPPPAMLDALYRYRDEKRVADIVSLPVANAPDPGQPSADELSQFYDKHQDQFRAPEYRGFTMASLVPADVAKGIEIPEDKLREQYKERADEFETPERRQVQQILAPSEAKAKEAEAALAAGTDWQEVATKIAGQKPDTIDLGLVSKQELPEAIADTAFDLEPDKPSEPVRSSFGWHILRVLKIEPPANQSFDEAKPKLLEEMTHDEALDRVYKVANQADDALAGGAGIDDIVAKFGLNKTEIAAVDQTGHDPEGKPVAAPDAALQLAFATGEGQTSRVTEAEDGGAFVLRVDKVMPPKVRPLDEVKDKVTAAWQAEQRRQSIAKAADELKAAVTPETKLAAAAAAKGLTATTSPPLPRTPGRDTAQPAQLIAELFAAKPGDVVIAANTDGAWVAQLDEVQAPEAATPDAGKDLSLELARALRDDLSAEFAQALRRRFPVEVHTEAVAKVF
jgi:peptidyl-prolyl cis-trans isomerase D